MPLPETIAADLTAALKAGEKDRGDCPIRVDAEQTMVVEATELQAKCPSKYKGADSNKLDTTYK